MDEYKGIKSNIPFLIVICVALFAFCFIFSYIRVGAPIDAGALDPAVTDMGDTADPSGGTSVTGETQTADTAVTDSPVNDAVITDPPVTAGPVDDPRGVLYPNQIARGEDVGEEYFRDALFIGDSRTVGFQTSTSLNATFYSKISFNISQLTKTDDISRFITVNVNGEPVKCNVYEALEHKADYGKVYLCMGLSELGWDEDVFFDAYRNTLDYIIAKMPAAKIYIQTLIPVTAEYSNLAKFGVTNERIWMYNEWLAQLAEEYGVYLVNPAELFLDEENALPTECAADGLHLYGKYYREWFDYLRVHAVK